MLLLINLLINMDTNSSVSNFNSFRIFQFKLMFTHHMFCRYMHKYLANDQEYSVEF